MKNLDQFYTKPEIAEGCVKALSDKYPLWWNMFVIEPSAGTGAFVLPLKKLGVSVHAIDIDPKALDIEKGDFLSDEIEVNGQPVAVVGNPPFGKCSSMAIRFFNRAAEMADLIAFIVPRTFRKISVQDRLHRNFWLVEDETIPRRAFIKDGKPHDVPCAWQVWERRKRKRPEIPTPDVSGIIEYVDMESADFALRRVGGTAGTVLEKGEYENLCEGNLFFLRSVGTNAKSLLSSIDWSVIRSSTAGQRSVSKREIAIELDKLTRGA